MLWAWYFMGAEQARSAAARQALKPRWRIRVSA